MRNPLIFVRNFTTSLMGRLYSNYKDSKEKFRIKRYKTYAGKPSRSIVWQFILFSIKFSTPIFTLALFSLFLDYHFSSHIISLLRQLGLSRLISASDLKDVISIGVGATSAMLGIIFALFTVQFQIYTEKYSQDVTDYINQEKVSQNFFKILIFTTIFNLLTLILIEVVDFTLLITLIVSILLIFTSVAGIIIFRNDYVSKSKPISIFIMLSNDIYGYVNYVKGDNKTKSYSVVASLQERTEERLNIFFALLNDLNRAKLYDDWHYGIILLGHLLLSYCKEKILIDNTNSLWFPYRQIQTSKYDSITFSLKQDFESKGIGIFTQSVKNYNWLEKRVYAQFNNLIDNNLLVNIEDYQSFLRSLNHLLCGENTIDNEDYTKSVKSLWELQDFDNLNQVLKLHEKLIEKIIHTSDLEKEDLLILALDNTAMLRRNVIDGFNLRVRAGVVISYQDELKQLLRAVYTDIELHQKTNRHTNQPRFIYQTITDYIYKLTVEIAIEGHTITPEESFINEILVAIEIEEKQRQKDILLKTDNLISTMIKVADENNYQTLQADILHVVLFNLTQALDLGQYALIDIILKDLDTIPLSITQSSRKQLERNTTQNTLENLVFQSTITNQMNLFEYSLMALFIYWGLFRPDTKNSQATLKYLRLPFLIGAFIYLYSEFKANDKFINFFMQKLNIFFPNKQNLKNLITSIEKVNIWLYFASVAYEETERYRRFYRAILNEVQELPRDFSNDDKRRPWSTFEHPVDHESELIRKLSLNEYSDMKEVIDLFLEYILKELNKTNK